MGHPKLTTSDPNLVTAFIMAQQDAVARLSAMDKGNVSDLAKKYWELDPKLGSLVVGDDVLFARGWCWPTEGDATAILEISKFMVEGKLIPKPLAWSQVRDAFAPAGGGAARSVREDRQQARRRRVRRVQRQGPARPSGVGVREMEGAHVMRVGFVGLGTMGAPMARNVMKGGHALTVYDVNEAAVRALVDVGATAARSPKELAAASDIVITMLPDGPDVERVALGPEGIIEGIRADAIYVDMSTIDPAVTRAVGAAMKKKGVANDRQPGRQDRGVRGSGQADADGRRRRGRDRALPSRARLHGH
jgi:hypothetical protein